MDNKLAQITIEGYKGLHLRLPLNENLTVIVGDSGRGKTRIVECFKLLDAIKIGDVSSFSQHICETLIMTVEESYGAIHGCKLLTNDQNSKIKKYELESVDNRKHGMNDISFETVIVNDTNKWKIPRDAWEKCYTNNIPNISIYSLKTVGDIDNTYIETDYETDVETLCVDGNNMVKLLYHMYRFDTKVFDSIVENMSLASRDCDAPTQIVFDNGVMLFKNRFGDIFQLSEISRSTLLFLFYSFLCKAPTRYINVGMTIIDDFGDGLSTHQIYWLMGMLGNCYSGNQILITTKHESVLNNVNIQNVVCLVTRRDADVLKRSDVKLQKVSEMNLTQNLLDETLGDLFYRGWLQNESCYF